jgi:hypothetical protein
MTHFIIMVLAGIVFSIGPLLMLSFAVWALKCKNYIISFLSAMYGIFLLVCLASSFCHIFGLS